MAWTWFHIVFVIIHTMFTLNAVLPLQIRIVGVCEIKFISMCQSIFEYQLEKPKYSLHLHRNLKNSANITWKIIECGSDFVENLRKLRDLDDNLDNVLDVGIAIGDAPVVNAASTYANSTNMPLFLYDTSKEKNPLFKETFVPLYASNDRFGLATRRLVGEQSIEDICFLTQSNHIADGFVEGFWNTSSIKSYLNRTFVLQENFNRKSVFLTLQTMQEHDCKVVIVHSDPELTVISIGMWRDIQHFFQAGFVWLLTSYAVPIKTDQHLFLTNGLLSVERNEGDEELHNIITRTLISITDVSNTYIDTHSMQEFKSFIYRLITSVPFDESNLGLSFETQNNRANISYVIKNKNDEKIGSDNGWHNIGDFNMLEQDIDAITWPGNSLFGPHDEFEQRIYRVVTRPAEPFVFIKDGDGTCLGEVRCIKIINGDPRFYPNVSFNYSDITYQHYCCSGVAVDVLRRLSVDLEFEFILYFEDDSDYGTLHDNGTWTGMLGDVMTGKADMVAGAFSMTTERLQHIIFTEPFFFSGYSMVTPSEPPSPSIDAFLTPLDWSVWFCIFVSATVVGFATSILEWNSPFGLNPWGKKRTKNYTLGSGLVMAYSVLFGHTVRTKTPKGWPSKVLQNLWSSLAIFIVASYTANLAAFLAGNTNQNQLNNIYDEKLYEKHLSAMPSSAVTTYLKKVNPRISSTVIETKYNSTMDAITSLRHGYTDVYLDDTAILGYALSVNDTNCSVLFSGREFGENLYSIGLPNGDSWLRDQLSALILMYVESGQMETINRKFTQNRECKDNMARQYLQYNLDHTGGLFIMLTCAVFLAILLLGWEHLVYRYFVPYIRKKPSNSKWKSRNFEYINQRVYRTIMSQKLVSPQQTAREMVKLMKDRQFTRLFQKNELRSPRNIQKEENKGLRFMNLTDKLMRVQNSVEEDNTSCDTNDNSVGLFTTSSSANLYKVPEEDEKTDAKHANEVHFTVEGDDEHPLEDESFSDNNPSKPTLELSQEFSTPNNLKQTDERSLAISDPQRVDSVPSGRKVRVNCLWKRHSCLEHGSRDLNDKFEDKDSRTRMFSDSSDVELNRQISNHHRRFGTWPTLPSTEDLTSSYHKPRDYRSSPSMSIEECDNMTPSDCNSDKEMLISNRPKLERSDAVNMDNSNYYKHSLKMKDNRVKSTIRRHAIAKFRRQSSSMFDECAVDALTKEDLLVLWKRSEIELQSKLNRVTLQNAHLKRLLRMVDHNRKDAIDAQGNDPQFVCTRL